VARQRERERARIEHEREAKRLGFRAYAQQYLAWAKLRHRGWDTEKSRVTAMSAAFVDMKLDAITTADVESFQDGLLEKRSQSTANRYRTLMHAMFNRAIRHGLLTVNPVKGVAKFKEPEGRIQYLMPEEEAAVRAALAPEALRTGRPKLDTVRPDLRPLFAVSVHTGLRWSEQLALRWADVDLLTGLITVRHSKTGYSRQVPMNSVVRSAALDLAAQRGRPDDPEEPVFRCSYTAPDKFFPKAVERARKVLIDVGRDASRLDGYTWHCNRHSFASRLVMAGVDLRTVQVLGGWRTLAMVQRYSHLAPAHLREAVERLVPAAGGVELSRNYPEPAIRAAGVS
jgi:site-specific recombinase XerD